MNKVVQSPFRVASSEMIAKLIRSGYLQLARRHDADAVTKAIAYREIVPRILGLRGRFHPHQIAIVQHPPVGADCAVVGEASWIGAALIAFMTVWVSSVPALATASR